MICWWRRWCDEVWKACEWNSDEHKMKIIVRHDEKLFNFFLNLFLSFADEIYHSVMIFMWSKKIDVFVCLVNAIMQILISIVPNRRWFCWFGWLMMFLYFTNFRWKYFLPHLANIIESNYKNIFTLNKGKLVDEIMKFSQNEKKSWEWKVRGTRVEQLPSSAHINKD